MWGSKKSNHIRNVAHPAEEERHRYPPHPPHTSAPIVPEPTKLSRTIFRFTKIFAFRRKCTTVHTSSVASDQITEFGATTPTQTSTPTSTNSTSLPASPAQSTCAANAKARPKKTPAPKHAPPIVVPSWRYKAEPQTFTVRVEQEFSVTCTVVRPVSRFQFFGWPAFLRFKLGCLRRRRRSGKVNVKGTTAEGDKKTNKMKRAKRKSRGGVAVEQDVCDDLETWSIIEYPLEARSRPKTQSQSQQEKQIKATRRNSAGWAGVFSSTACQPDPSTTGTGSSTSRSRSQSHTRSSQDDEEQASFVIDRNSRMLVIPDMDIGVARVVKEELEEVIDHREAEIRLVKSSPRNPNDTFEVDAFGRDSMESWLDLE